MDIVPRNQNGALDLKPKKHHGYSVVLFILGTLFPPFAVAARFGIGKDFWLNLLLTLCGYFPGHGHNFYIQNIRNNKNRARTPKWATRYGLVDPTGMNKKKKKSQWANRYGDRLPHSTLEGQEVEEGQVPDREPDTASTHGQQDQGLWRPEDERYFGQRDSSSFQSDNSGGRWTYPANFDDAVVESDSRRKKKSKKDRWTRTEEAYANEDYGSRRVKKKKSRRSTRTETSGGPSEYYAPGDELDAGYDPAPEQRSNPGAKPANGESRRGEFDHEF